MNGPAKGEASQGHESKGNPLPSSLAALRHISKTARLKAKTKKFLGIQQEPPRGSVKAPTLAPTPSKDTDGDRLVLDLPEQKFPPVKDMFRNPVEIVQTAIHLESGNQFVKQLDMKVISQGADVQIVSKYNEITSEDDEETKMEALQNLDELKKSRQDSFVRWTMDRHVRKVRRVPQQTVAWRDKEEFIVADEDGKRTMQWEEYGCHVRPILHTLPTSVLFVSFLEVALRTKREMKRLLTRTAYSLLCRILWRPLYRGFVRNASHDQRRHHIQH
jgi:hypothetical protein